MNTNDQREKIAAAHRKPKDCQKSVAFTSAPFCGVGMEISFSGETDTNFLSSENRWKEEEQTLRQIETEKEEAAVSQKGRVSGDSEGQKRNT